MKILDYLDALEKELTGWKSTLRHSLKNARGAEEIVAFRENVARLEFEIEKTTEEINAAFDVHIEENKLWNYGKADLEELFEDLGNNVLSAARAKADPEKVDLEDVEYYADKFERKMSGSARADGMGWVFGSGCNKATCDAIWDQVRNLCVD